MPSEKRKDNLYVFDLEDHRQELLKPVIDQLKAQAKANEPARVVAIDGLVKEPGEYPLVNNMLVSDLITAAGGLTESAYSLGAVDPEPDVTGFSGRVNDRG